MKNAFTETSLTSNLEKSFCSTDLMKLKRTGSKNNPKKKEKSEAFISRQAPGMCFDFNQKVRKRCEQRFSFIACTKKIIPDFKN